jgi:hypothetical protein
MGTAAGTAAGAAAGFAAGGPAGAVAGAATGAWLFSESPDELEEARRTYENSLNRYKLIDPPKYWGSLEVGKFHRVNDSPVMKTVAHDLMNKSRSDVITRDGRERIAPKGFEIVAAQRIENSELWESYAKKMKEIYERKTVTKICRVVTTGLLAQDIQDSLQHAVNEVYLFHGCSIDAAENISKTGFKLDLAGTSSGIGFGKGAYFAERSTKSDEYAGGGKQKRVKIGLKEETHFAMLLCRVCLGEMCRITEFDTSAERHVIGSRRFDSLLGDREAAAGSFREFIVYDAAQVYPEYAIIYKRSMQKPHTPR